MNKLYVFIQGLTVIAERKDGKLEIVMPLVRGHVYKAGSWLAESPVERGNTIELTGVKSGKASIHDPLIQATSPTGFLATIPRPYTITRRRRAATVVVPKPAEILGFLRATGPNTTNPNFAVRLNSVPPVLYRSVADVLILVYRYKDANQILLDGHYWQPCLTPSAISLHLIATSEVPESAQHVADTEDALSEVFLNYPGCTYTRSNAPPWMDANHPRFGTAPGLAESDGYMMEGKDVAFALAELEDPPARAKRLERLGRMHREKRRIDCLWRRPDPLCADDTVCLTYAGSS
jgi:hypothetical protein